MICKDLILSGAAAYYAADTVCVVTQYFVLLPGDSTQIDSSVGLGSR